MISIFGDKHFTDSKVWKKLYTKACVQYLINHPENKVGNTWVEEGDITDEFLASGWTIHQVFLLYSQIKADVIICRGNHPVKKRRGEYTYTLELLKELPNIHVVEVPEHRVIEGVNIVFMPHLAGRTNGLQMDEYYAQLHTLEGFDQSFDLGVGHFSDGTDGFTHIDISQMKIKDVILGHIHKPLPNFIGSMTPNKTDESGDERYYANYTKDKGQVRIPLPEWVRYTEIHYPEPLPPSNAMYNVYTVAGCTDESLIRQEYGDDIIIKDCYSKEHIEAFEIKSNDSHLDPIDMLEDALTELDIPEAIKDHIRKAF